MLKFSHMYVKNQLPNPYDRKSVDLSGVHISPTHNEWFARDILAINHTEVEDYIKSPPKYQGWMVSNI